MNDLDGIKAQLEALTTEVQNLKGVQELLIHKFETRIPLVDGFDDRIARCEATARTLTNTALKLAATKALTSWIPGAIAGAIAGGTVALALLALR